ncbi:MAG: segregation and condensation protein A [Solirubrobacterales bacterium]
MASRLDLDLDLDLDVFVGPFDLLLSIVLREEVSLLDVELGEIVASYVTKLEGEGEMELEVATEFLVLVASLLELKSRLMLPGVEEELSEMEPAEAVEELVARMLEYRRYRDAGRVLADHFESQRGYMYRSAPLPLELRRVAVETAEKVYDPDQLAAAMGDLLEPPARPYLYHIKSTVSLQRRLSVLRTALMNRSDFDFDERFGEEDRLTQAVTILALLDLYNKGEATWDQSEICGPITVRRSVAGSNHLRETA